MPRLRTVSTRDPGGRGSTTGVATATSTSTGRPLGTAEVERVKALVIPPAWRDVWISPYPNAPPAGGRHRRGRAAAVPLPPRVAREARRGEVRPGHRDGHQAARRARSGSGRTSPDATSPGTPRSRPRSASSTSAASGSGPTPTPSRTAATGSPPSSAGTSAATATAGSSPSPASPASTTRSA